MVVGTENGTAPKTGRVRFFIGRVPNAIRITHKSAPRRALQQVRARRGLLS
jgi:hypothetical protein